MTGTQSGAVFRDIVRGCFNGFGWIIAVMLVLLFIGFLVDNFVPLLIIGGVLLVGNVAYLLITRNKKN